MQHHHTALKTFFALLCKLKIITKNPAQALPVIRIRGVKSTFDPY
jgi:hypothetical protein